MTIEISAEDHAMLQNLVASGRFGSISEAVHESALHFAQEDAPDAEWKRQLDAGIDRGLADVEVGRYRPANEFLAELKARHGA